MFVRAHEGYLDQGIMVKDSKLLRAAYRKSSWFKKDIVSILPTDFFYFLFPGECHYQIPCNVIVRLNRIAKIERMFQFFDKTETSTNFPNAFRILKIVFYILVLIHWNACLYFTVSFYIGFNTDTWVYQGDPSLATQYCYSFYWSTLTLTKIGETPLPEPDNNYELCFVTGDFLIGVLIFAAILGNISMVISNMTTEKTAFSNRMDAIKGPKH